MPNTKKSSISLDLNEYTEIIDCLKILNVNYDGDCDGCDGNCKRCIMDNKMVKVIKKMEKKVLLLK